MTKEKMYQLWTNYINELFYTSKLFNELPDLFSEPNCATCAHWQRVNEDTLETISIFSPKEYKQICLGLEGKILKFYKVDGEYEDSYNTHIFYGFCRRFPPTWPESDSITKKGLFSMKNVKTPRVLGYKFPFVPHKEHCGEWKQGAWVNEVISVQGTK